jgi:hypothetical protein
MSEATFCSKCLSKLEELIKSYPKDGKWDDELVMWAYVKGYKAGVAHRDDEEQEKCES